ncbi:MAG: NTP transferase domain-containing protein [DPANN group archaeon]|nr:NTP transferase domain-containing protein [DPANN group archaeon]
MQAVILAAGVGKRMRPFSYIRPKPMMPILNKPILEHTLEELQGLVDEVIIVTSYLEHKIQDYFGAYFKDIRIMYVTQKKSLGTAHALLSAHSLIKNRFIVLNGDDLYSNADFKNMLKYKYCVLAKSVDNPESFGILTLSGNKIIQIIEKPKNPQTNIANTGAYVLDKSIFKIISYLDKSERGEYELTDAVSKLLDLDDVYCIMVEDLWLSIRYLHDVLYANTFKLNKLAGLYKQSIISPLAIVENQSSLNGFVKIGKNTIIKNGTYIEGPVIIGDNCVIGPTAFIRSGTTIGNNCHIGSFCEVKNSIVMNNTKIPHLSYVGDSVIGENCNLGAGTKTANLRHDCLPVKITYNGETVVASDLIKVGTFIADYTKTAIDTKLNPGVVIGPFSWTLPGSYVSGVIPPFHLHMRDSISTIKEKHIDSIVKEDCDKLLLKKLYSEMII